MSRSCQILCLRDRTCARSRSPYPSACCVHPLIRLTLTSLVDRRLKRANGCIPKPSARPKIRGYNCASKCRPASRRASSRSTRSNSKRCVSSSPVFSLPLLNFLPVPKTAGPQHRRGRQDLSADEEGCGGKIAYPFPRPLPRRVLHYANMRTLRENTSTLRPLSTEYMTQNIFRSTDYQCSSTSVNRIQTA